MGEVLRPRLFYDFGIEPSSTDHYAVLGVSRNASAEKIRATYRELAREHHPDRVASGGAARRSMSEINEAYRVLSDPVRRYDYDRSAGRAEPSDSPAPQPQGPRSARPASDGPAKIPWKAMSVAAVVGSFLVLVSAAFVDQPADEIPDGILQTGSCIAIEPNGDAREIACTGLDDIVVELLVPTDAQCPVEMEPHRDRLGLGLACIARP